MVPPNLLLQLPRIDFNGFSVVSVNCGRFSPLIHPPECLYTECMETLWAYRNGTWIPRSQLAIDVDDFGFLMGATVTERLRTFRGQVFRLDEHLRRMHRSLEIVGLDAPALTREFTEAIPEFIVRHKPLIAIDGDWYIVAFATPGVGGHGKPTVCVHGGPLPFHQWADKFEVGQRVFISSIRQVPNNCWPAELKCRSRMHYYLADREATARQSGARAIVLDQEGHVAEATSANLVIYRKLEGLITPMRDNVLSGVSLGVMQELAAGLDVPFITRNFYPNELRTAEEAMLTSTSICVLPIIECDSHPLGTGAPGPIYRQLLAAWNDLVGIDFAEQARQFSASSRR